MLPLLSPSQWLTLHSAAVLLALATYAAVSLARRQRRSPSAAVAWVLFLALAPYLGLPLFLVFGTRKALRGGPKQPRMPVRDAIRLTPGPAARIRALARSMGLPDAVGYRDLVIHRDGPHALARFKAVIESAQHSIEISTFVLGRDAVGDEMGALLGRRVREGVRVRLLLDGAGRFFGGVPQLERLRKAGVEVALFGRLLSWPPGSGANLRNHRKMTIADGRWMWTGGRNLAAEYFAGTASASSSAWTDLTFDLQGAIVDEARAQFERDWGLASGARGSDAPHEAGRRAEASAEPLGQFLPSGPDFTDDTLYELLLDACFAASERILAVTPYFVPDAALVMALTLAARRGVRVELVVPRRSNHRLADLARPSAIRDLLDAGAHVWFTPAMLHGKLLVIDDTAALAGSLNLDSRSLFLNYEMMVAFYEQQAIDGFVAWASAARSGAERVQPRAVSAWRQIGEGLLRWLTFQL